MRVDMIEDYQTFAPAGKIYGMLEGLMCKVYGWVEDTCPACGSYGDVYYNHDNLVDSNVIGNWNNKYFCEHCTYSWAIGRWFKKHLFNPIKKKFSNNYLKN